MHRERAPLDHEVGAWRPRFLKVAGVARANESAIDHETPVSILGESRELFDSDDPNAGVHDRLDLHRLDHVRVEAGVAGDVSTAPVDQRTGKPP